MRNREVDVEKKICDLSYRFLGVKGRKLQIVGEVGFQDRVFFIPGGKPLFMEIKRSGEDLRPKQSDVHFELKILGYHVHPCDNVYDGFKTLIDLCESEAKTAIKGKRLPKPVRVIFINARNELAKYKRR